MGRGAKIFFASGAVALLAFGLIAYFIVSAIYGIDPGHPFSVDTEAETQDEYPVSQSNYGDPAAVGKYSPDSDVNLLCGTLEKEISQTFYYKEKIIIKIQESV